MTTKQGYADTNNNAKLALEAKIKVAIDDISGEGTIKNDGSCSGDAKYKIDVSTRLF